VQTRSCRSAVVAAGGARSPRRTAEGAAIDLQTGFRRISDGPHVGARLDIETGPLPTTERVDEVGETSIGYRSRAQGGTQRISSSSKPEGPGTNGGALSPRSASTGLPDAPLCAACPRRTVRMLRRTANGPSNQIGKYHLRSGPAATVPPLLVLPSLRIGSLSPHGAERLPPRTPYGGQRPSARPCAASQRRASRKRKPFTIAGEGRTRLVSRLKEGRFTRGMLRTTLTPGPS